MRLEEVAAISAALTYTYDPDDDWRDAVTIEAVEPASQTTYYTHCVAGGVRVRPKTAAIRPVRHNCCARFPAG
ncbi:hypothetical protein [Burkholderia vietnamiensis]|uniref:hypothetical protein n=1 Tax=Burkholderia vietnamiensis TaxID=60552 RepID=UPI00158C50D7